MYELSTFCFVNVDKIDLGRPLGDGKRGNVADLSILHDEFPLQISLGETRVFHLPLSSPPPLRVRKLQDSKGSWGGCLLLACFLCVLHLAMPLLMKVRKDTRMWCPGKGGKAFAKELPEEALRGHLHGEVAAYSATPSGKVFVC